MFEVMQRHGGVISDIAGDEVMCIWGCPGLCSIGLRRCCRCGRGTPNGGREIQSLPSPPYAANQDRHSCRLGASGHRRWSRPLCLHDRGRCRQHGVAHRGAQQAVGHPAVGLGGRAGSSEGFHPAPARGIPARRQVRADPGVRGAGRPRGSEQSCAGQCLCRGVRRISISRLGRVRQDVGGAPAFLPR